LAKARNERRGNLIFKLIKNLVYRFIDEFQITKRKNSVTNFEILKSFIDEFRITKRMCDYKAFSNLTNKKIPAFLVQITSGFQRKLKDEEKVIARSFSPNL